MNAYAVVLIEDVDDLIHGMHMARNMAEAFPVTLATVLVVSATKPSVHAPYMATDAWKTRKTDRR